MPGINHVSTVILLFSLFFSIGPISTTTPLTRASCSSASPRSSTWSTRCTTGSSARGRSSGWVSDVFFYLKNDIFIILNHYRRCSFWVRGTCRTSPKKVARKNKTSLRRFQTRRNPFSYCPLLLFSLLQRKKKGARVEFQMAGLALC